MKKHFSIFYLIILTVIFLLPILSFATSNDVTLTTDTILSVGGYTINITGSSAVIQSIVVNATNFTVTLLPGSYIKISSPTYNQLSTDITTFTTSNNCRTNTSALTLSSSGSSGTVTVTPSAMICSTTAPIPTQFPPPSGNGAPVGLLGQNRQNISNLLSTSTSLASLQNQIASLTLQMNALLTQTHTKVSGNTQNNFVRNLSLNMKGEDVRTLQQFLNTHGFIISTTGTGSLGNETTLFGTLTYKSLKAFQKSVGLPSTGFFGKITRDYINKK